MIKLSDLFEWLNVTGVMSGFIKDVPGSQKKFSQGKTSGGYVLSVFHDYVVTDDNAFSILHI